MKNTPNTSAEKLEIFLVCPPGFEEILRAELTEKGFKKPKIDVGGVAIVGTWQDVWRANLQSRCATRVLVRIGKFSSSHLAQLDKQTHEFPWADFLQKNTSVRLEASCRKSKIYHEKAVIERFAKALKNTMNIQMDQDSDLSIKIRILNNICTISIDSSGAALHIRGHKQALNKAPLRETLAALSLRACGYKGKEPVIDPMCGSGTFVMEAAEIASRLDPGRSRNFAFEQLVTFNPEVFQTLKSASNPITPDLMFYGYDRDKGAIDRCHQNAAAADISSITQFNHQAISQLTQPDEKTGLIMINPPYGVRIGETKKLTPLYQALGQKLSSQFSGWRVGMITNNDALAKSTGLNFEEKPISFSHGGIKVKLYQATLG